MRGFNEDFAKSTGYVPNSILATPLQSGERIIGVMEVLDKVNAPSFGIKDMEFLALFAQQAAMAIDNSIKISLINEALVIGLKRLAETEITPTPDELLQVLEIAGDRQTGADLLALADFTVQRHQHAGRKRAQSLPANIEGFR